DGEAVKNTILGRSGIADINQIIVPLKRLGDTFESLREHLISLLLVASQSKKGDAYIERKSNAIIDLELRTPHRIAHEMLPSGQIMSRDSTAMTQGLRIAPHQLLQAYNIFASKLDHDLSLLEKSASEVASHLRRMRSHNLGRRDESAGGTIFIGHGRSPLWREL